MQSLLRLARLPARSLRPAPLLTSTPRRYASESYGGSQSGQQEVNKDTPNPKADLEHPGPKAPADKGSAQSEQSQGSDSGSQSGSSSSSGGRPAIHEPGPPPENKDAEVEAHNKEMEKRNDRTANQLYEGDNKVDKNYWSAGYYETDMEEQQQEQVTPQVATIATPINFVLLALFLLIAYYRLRPTAPVTLPKGPPPVVFQTYTPRTLLKNNGENGKPVFLAVKGKVYDVSSGRNFYGPGGPYENFAGRDATRGLACQSFDEDMLTKDLDGPLDDCSDLDKDQIDNLNGWIERFNEKYLVVGNLKSYDRKKLEIPNDGI